MNVTRREFLAKTLAGAALTAAPAFRALGQAAPLDSRPNVLFIAVDDMNTDLGCYGSALVQSPNLDRLASQGVRFDRTYCQFPWCSPSRSSLLTGRRPDTTRVFDLQAHFRASLPNIVTLPQMFINAGYHVARVGKIYHYGNPGEIGTNGLDDKVSWHERFNPAGLDKTALEPRVTNYTAGVLPRLGESLAYLADDEQSENHTDGMVAARAIQLLEKKRDKPFFIAAGFYRPHCPWIAPRKYFDLYPTEAVKLPKINSSAPEKYPPLALASTKPWPYFGATPEQARECKRAYYAAISYVDSEIGRLLDALDRLQLREKTIVVFWSDHGMHCGEHGLWFKQSLFEEAARVPLIISVPGQAAGTPVRRVVELVDLFPTLAELAGIRPPAGLEGASLVPLMRHPDGPWESLAFTQVQRGAVPGHSVRSQKWRFTEWGGGKLGQELYDEENDPTEQINLSGDTRFSEVVEFLRGRLREKHPHPVQALKGESWMKEKFTDN